jgi:hypothetical protein
MGASSASSEMSFPLLSNNSSAPDTLTASRLQNEHARPDWLSRPSLRHSNFAPKDVGAHSNRLRCASRIPSNKLAVALSGVVASVDDFASVGASKFNKKPQSA